MDVKETIQKNWIQILTFIITMAVGWATLQAEVEGVKVQAEENKTNIAQDKEVEQEILIEMKTLSTKQDDAINLLTELRTDFKAHIENN